MSQQSPVRHHYVPRFYQRAFTRTDDGHIWVYRRGQSPVHQPIKDTGMDWDFYNFNDHFGRVNRTVEHEHLQMIDNDAATIIRYLEDNFKAGKPLPLSNSQRKKLSVFVSAMMRRVPHFRRNVELAAPTITAGVFDRLEGEIDAELVNLADDPEATAELSRLREQISILRPTYINGPTDFLFAHEVARSSVFEVALRRMVWDVFRPRGDTEFVTSDNPTTWSSGLGLNNPAALVMLPLSRRLFLQAAWERAWGGVYKEISTQEAKLLNRQVAMNADTEVYASASTAGNESLVNRWLGESHRLR